MADLKVRRLNRQWIDVKVDLINLKVIIRKTQHIVNRDGWAVNVWGLTQAGTWLCIPEGEVYPDVCILPIKQFREELTAEQLAWCEEQGEVEN